MLPVILRFSPMNEANCAGAFRGGKPKSGIPS
jgi:hypothetical protein